MLTWLDRADREALVVHPRGAIELARRAACSAPGRRIDPTRSGCTRVQILAIDDTRIRVRSLEALDRTPVVDIKPVLGPVAER